MQNLLFEENIVPGYRPLARKYRPNRFSDMIGQGVLVQTLRNAIKNNKIPSAILLTGIRGVGKTTAARIIAKAINCTDKEEIDPCGKCANCHDISSDKSQDVLEIDAASNTGVDDIREIIENARYKPITSKYKVYIIDEVHMLSNSAFNALLKILEEPPTHVKFIFATTEVKKIPVTILSRCQRFDLKRVDQYELAQHYAKIVQAEKLEAENTALMLIANLAQGSVRDGLSLLDQALSFSNNNLKEDDVRKLLGLVEQAPIIDLLNMLASGDIKAALLNINTLHQRGIDPYQIAHELLEIIVKISKINVLEGDNILPIPYSEFEKLNDMGANLSISLLSRMWQMLNKGIEEIKLSHLPFSALEMIMIRIAYAAHLPSIEEIINSDQAETSIMKKRTLTVHQVKTPEDISNLLLSEKEVLLYHHFSSDVEIIEFKHNSLEIKLLDNAPKNFAIQLKQFLSERLNDKWEVLNHEGTKKGYTLTQRARQAEEEQIERIKRSEAVQQVLNTFTDMEIIDIKINS